MKAFQPIKQTRISEEVLIRLKEAILSGVYKAGDKLPSERELTQQLQVSRGVVREAIRVLEMTGFVTMRQGPSGGAFVTELTSDRLASGFLDLYLAGQLTIPELCQVRLHIEPEVARLAALRIDPEGARRLQEAADHERDAFSGYEDRMQRLTKVHQILPELCGNHLFEAMVNSMITLTHEIVSAVEPKDHNLVHGIGEHDAIVAAVVEGNQQAAHQAMVDHVTSFSEGLIRMDLEYRALPRR